MDRATLGSEHGHVCVCDSSHIQNGQVHTIYLEQLWLVLCVSIYTCKCAHVSTEGDALCEWERLVLSWSTWVGPYALVGVRGCAWSLRLHLLPPPPRAQPSPAGAPFSPPLSPPLGLHLPSLSLLLPPPTLSLAAVCGCSQPAQAFLPTVGPAWAPALTPGTCPHWPSLMTAPLSLLRCPLTPRNLPDLG